MNTWNQKVAKSRGKDWKAKLVAGKLESKINPTLLQLHRVKKKLNQTAVADKIGLTYATYGAYENGRRPIKVDVAQKISLFLSGSDDLKQFFIPTKNKNKVRAKRFNGK
jgi:transcriptional regulator with XRE-family HTH domain